MGAECRWAEGMGSVAADVLTPDEAKQLALRQARAKAIAQVIGVEVRSDAYVKDETAALFAPVLRAFSKHLLEGTPQQQNPAGKPEVMAA